MLSKNTAYFAQCLGTSSFKLLDFIIVFFSFPEISSRVLNFVIICGFMYGHIRSMSICGGISVHPYVRVFSLALNLEHKSLKYRKMYY